MGWNHQLDKISIKPRNFRLIETSWNTWILPQRTSRRWVLCLVVVVSCCTWAVRSSLKPFRRPVVCGGHESGRWLGYGSNGWDYEIVWQVEGMNGQNVRNLYACYSCEFISNVYETQGRVFGLNDKVGWNFFITRYHSTCCPQAPEMPKDHV